MKELTGTVEFNDSIQASLLDGEKIVVEFFTPTCVNCCMTQQLLKRQEPEWTVYSVDASKEENKELIQKWKIMSVPTVVVYYLYTNGEGAHMKTFGPSYKGKQLIEAIKQEFSGMYFDWYREIDGNLFDLNTTLALFPNTTSTDYVLAHCIAADFGMYGGIAKQFVDCFNMKSLLIDWALQTGIFSKHDLIGKSIFIPQHDYVQGTYNLITKPNTGEQPKEISGYQMILETLTDTRIQMKERKQQYLAIPQIGCGIDGLSWDVVRGIIQDIFRDSGIKVLIVTLKK